MGTAWQQEVREKTISAARWAEMVFSRTCCCQPALIENSSFATR